MVADGRYTAVLDRIEEGYAVVRLEADGEFIDRVMVERAVLPEDGQYTDAVFAVEVSDTEIVAVEHEPDAADGEPEC